MVQAGMGPRSSETALGYVLDEHNPDFIISTGFGGALYKDALPGDLIFAAKVFLIPEKILRKSADPFNNYNLADFNSLEIPDAAGLFDRLSVKVGMHKGNILTFERFAGKSDIKDILPADISFPVCDMETYFLAKLSIERRLPFFAVRSVTDLADEEIPPEFLLTTDEDGSYSVSRAIRMLLGNPKLLPDTIRIGKNSRTASNNLWRFVKALTEVL